MPEELSSKISQELCFWKACGHRAKESKKVRRGFYEMKLERLIGPGQAGFLGHGREFGF